MTDVLKIRPAADVKAAFRTWANTYLETMERVHPRYRAVELRRDLDALKKKVDATSAAPKKK